MAILCSLVDPSLPWVHEKAYGLTHRGGCSRKLQWGFLRLTNRIRARILATLSAMSLGRSLDGATVSKVQHVLIYLYWNIL